MKTATGLTNLQLELLKIFSYNLEEQQLLEIKSLLANYFAEQVTKNIDQLFEEKGWGLEKIEEWSKEHMRTRYD
ncbi:MAG: hypothetical protein AAF798_17300 [Bacteroidota bacterium]